ncbi:hypothetical protein ACHAWF_014808 [Thalassiosira exigua]
MLIRLFGEGCLTQCITVLEATIVCVSVLVSIFVRQFAIVVSACFMWRQVTMQREGGRNDRWKRNNRRRRDHNRCSR